MNINFGKYKYKSYVHILNLEPTYIKWLLNQSWFSKNYNQDYNYCKMITKDESYINKKDDIVIYTDGSCPNNGKPNAKCGIGIHFSIKNKIKFKDVSKMLDVNSGTNNIAELTAIDTALKLTNHLTNVKIYTDSKYAIDAVTEWYDIWKKRGTLDQKKNINIISSIYNLLNENKTKLIHVKAHTGKLDEHSIGNMVADKLASNCIKIK